MLKALAFGIAPEGKALVFDHPAGEVGEDWRQGGETLAVCYFSNAGGGRAPWAIPGYLGASRAVVAAIATTENAVAVQNVEISLWQQQGGKSGCVFEHR